jgi:hypothetical protein
MPGMGLPDIESVGYLAVAMRRTTVCFPPLPSILRNG